MRCQSPDPHPLALGQFGLIFSWKAENRNLKMLGGRAGTAVLRKVRAAPAEREGTRI